VSVRRRVLVVSYHYPPTSAVGALRVAKFVKHLPEFGWEPVVLTVRNPSARLEEANTGEACVVRVPMWPGPGVAYLAVRRRLSRQPLEAHRDLTFDQKDTNSQTPRGTVKRIVSSLLWCPDGAAGWWAPAVLAGRRVMREWRCSALLTVGPPHTAHLIGLALRRRGIRWIADFRDPWVDNPGKARFVRSAISDYVDERCEAAILRHSDAIVTTTKRLREQFIRRYPDASTRLHTIPNGIDRDDFQGISVQPSAKFTITHVGSVYYKRSPAPVFAAVRSLLDAGTLPRDAVSLVFAGVAADGIDLLDLARRHGLDDLLELPGMLPRRRALELIASAGALLLLAQDQPLQVPAKTYEYIAAGRPIIALTGEGATADTIRESAAGAVIASGDGDTLRNALLDAYTDWKRQLADGRPTLDALDPRFDRRRLTEQLVGLLSGSGF
jgi:glycosyltransferase involved in cell wall biosynthesis